MPANRQQASTSIRREIVKCLRSENYRIYPDGQRYLVQNGWDADSTVADLLHEIEAHEIFVLTAERGTAAKYDYVIRYPDIDLLLYAKISPKGGDPPMVYLTFHSHNIPGPPLPRIAAEDLGEPEDDDEKAQDR